MIAAGFWNSHVHSIHTPGLIDADKLSPDETTAQLEATRTKWGFTTVFAYRIRAEKPEPDPSSHRTGETKGPRIL